MRAAETPTFDPFGSETEEEWRERMSKTPPVEPTETDPHKALVRQFLVLWDRVVGDGMTLPLTSHTLSVWMRCEIEDVNGYLFSVATKQELRLLRDIAAVGMDGHKTLMQVQPQITKALAAEKQAKEAGRRLEQSSPSWRILDACGRIYTHSQGTPEHILAAADLVRACSLIH